MAYRRSRAASTRPAGETSRSPAVAATSRRLRGLAAQARGLALELERLHRAVQRSAQGRESSLSAPSACRAERTWRREAPRAASDAPSSPRRAPAARPARASPSRRARARRRMTKYNNEKSCMPPPASPGDAPPAPAGGESVQTAAMAAVPEGTPPAEAEAGGVLPAEAGVAPPIDGYSPKCPLWIQLYPNWIQITPPGSEAAQPARGPRAPRPSRGP